jgi:dTDP-glucose pyrophosphorylase
MKNWRNSTVPPSATIKDAIEVLEREALQIVLVVDDACRLLGTLTDGDIRRSFLRGVDLQQKVSCAMNPHPITVRPGVTREEALALMQSKSIRQCPVVNASGVIESLCLLDEFLKPPCLDNPVILMAGGLGTRLAPLTDHCPKPLLEVGGQPILKIIIDNFAQQGFHDFYVAVNYRAQMIKDRLGDGGAMNINIRYIEENERLGTAGALALLPQRPTCPFIVMNADVLTRVNFASLLQYHDEHDSDATMAIRAYDFQVPFGVVELDGYNINEIVEKPVQKLFVNAGIYCLEPLVLDFIPAHQPSDMPDVFRRLKQSGKKTCCFPVREYWIDIGQMHEFQRANAEYSDENSNEV